jgi:hypothetical protein
VQRDNGADSAAARTTHQSHITRLLVRRPSSSSNQAARPPDVARGREEGSAGAQWRRGVVVVWSGVLLWDDRDAHVSLW